MHGFPPMVITGRLKPKFMPARTTVEAPIVGPGRGDTPVGKTVGSEKRTTRTFDD